MVSLQFKCYNVMEETKKKLTSSPLIFCDQIKKQKKNRLP